MNTLYLIKSVIDHYCVIMHVIIYNSYNIACHLLSISKVYNPILY